MAAVLLLMLLVIVLSVMVTILGLLLHRSRKPNPLTQQKAATLDAVTADIHTAAEALTRVAAEMERLRTGRRYRR